jgi:MFS family permease
LADKGKRKRLIVIGTIIWSLSVFLTAHARSYFQLLIYQMFTGIGLGCIASIGFSVLTDSAATSASP